MAVRARVVVVCPRDVVGFPAASDQTEYQLIFNCDARSNVHAGTIAQTRIFCSYGQRRVAQNTFRVTTSVCASKEHSP